MKKAILAIIAACLGCCALLFVLPGLAGLSVLGLAARHLDTLLCALPLAVLAMFAVAAGMRWLRRHRAKCAADRSCGC